MSDLQYPKSAPATIAFLMIQSGHWCISSFRFKTSIPGLVCLFACFPIASQDQTAGTMKSKVGANTLHKYFKPGPSQIRPADMDTESGQPTPTVRSADTDATDQPTPSVRSGPPTPSVKMLRDSPQWVKKAEAIYGSTKPTKTIDLSLFCAGIGAFDRAIKEYGATRPPKPTSVCGHISFQSYDQFLYCSCESEI